MITPGDIYETNVLGAQRQRAYSDYLTNRFVYFSLTNENKVIVFSVEKETLYPYNRNLVGFYMFGNNTKYILSESEFRCLFR